MHEGAALGSMVVFSELVMSIGKTSIGNGVEWFGE